jgi:hypothetical protein
MSCSAQNVVTAPRGASSGHCAIASRTRGSMGSLAATARASGPARGQKCHHHQQRKCHRCPDTDSSPMSCDITQPPPVEAGLWKRSRDGTSSLLDQRKRVESRDGTSSLLDQRWPASSTGGAVSTTEGGFRDGRRATSSTGDQTGSRDGTSSLLDQRSMISTSAGGFRDGRCATSSIGDESGFRDGTSALLDQRSRASTSGGRSVVSGGE